MTPALPISEELLRFLDANVDSTEQLELLRIVAESPDRDWSMQELTIKAQALPTAISALEQRGLLKTHVVGSEVRCKSGSLIGNTLLAQKVGVRSQSNSECRRILRPTSLDPPSSLR